MAASNKHVLMKKDNQNTNKLMRATLVIWKKKIRSPGDIAQFFNINIFCKAFETLPFVNLVIALT